MLVIHQYLVKQQWRKNNGGLTFALSEKKIRYLRNYCNKASSTTKISHIFGYETEVHWVLTSLWAHNIRSTLCLLPGWILKPQVKNLQWLGGHQLPKPGSPDTCQAFRNPTPVLKAWLDLARLLQRWLVPIQKTVHWKLYINISYLCLMIIFCNPRREYELPQYWWKQTSFIVVK